MNWVDIWEPYCKNRDLDLNRPTPRLGIFIVVAPNKLPDKLQFFAAHLGETNAGPLLFIHPGNNPGYVDFRLPPWKMKR